MQIKEIKHTAQMQLLPSHVYRKLYILSIKMTKKLGTHFNTVISVNFSNC